MKASTSKVEDEEKKSTATESELDGESESEVEGEGENDVDGGGYEVDDFEVVLRKQRVDLAKFRIQLSKQGLRIKDVGADGNCFFRAIAD